MIEYTGSSFLIPDKLTKTRKKRKRKTSLYREQKIAVHITINGKGVVARLMTRKQYGT